MRKKAVTTVARNHTLSAECATYLDCIEQADICCEQARAAAQLKRYGAASGLFRTAQNLYQRALTIGGDACYEARERLQHLSAEIATYGDLAKSVSRPIRQQPIPIRIPVHESYRDF